ncbi:KH domain-containing protein [Patescibacteria group bacterium]|nr:KH domain-containing protein [Patescibacteria group bacterium]
MKDLLNFILENIVQKKDDIKITENKIDNIVNIKLHVNKDDIGRVIGKNGKVIKSIRTLLKIYSIKSDQRVYLDVVEETAS